MTVVELEAIALFARNNEMNGWVEIKKLTDFLLDIRLATMEEEAAAAKVAVVKPKAVRKPRTLPKPSEVVADGS